MVCALKISETKHALIKKKKVSWNTIHHGTTVHILVWSPSSPDSRTSCTRKCWSRDTVPA